ncbi:hypothetical protein FEK30_04375 [Picosynechococcus sp. PCC 11901]|uniref:KGK domain-containing protein n=1 Tax=unclassified Picosynechococcus TaxID=3079910 RepID=UPI0004AAC556|nr:MULTISPECIES: KGK domain-containing protein [unclassified Picosynechococcus]QCS48732.1 hypothetical protein FEK30_04375 [Picosynechococcus sp. PCC 11901]
MANFKHLQTSCDPDDVIKFHKELETFGTLDEKLQSALNSYVKYQGNNIVALGDALADLLQEKGLKFPLRGYSTFNAEYPCSVLKTDGGGWKKGKVRFRYALEVIIDEEEEVLDTSKSPLDDIRQSINNSKEV